MLGHYMNFKVQLPYIWSHACRCFPSRWLSKQSLVIWLGQILNLEKKKNHIRNKTSQSPNIFCSMCKCYLICIFFLNLQNKLPHVLCHMQAENVPLKAHMSISYEKLSKIGFWKNGDIKTAGKKKNIFSCFSKSVCLYTCWTEPILSGVLK